MKNKLENKRKSKEKEEKKKRENVKKKAEKRKERERNKKWEQILKPKEKTKKKRKKTKENQNKASYSNCFYILVKLFMESFLNYIGVNIVVYNEDNINDDINHLERKWFVLFNCPRLKHIQFTQKQNKSNLKMINDLSKKLINSWLTPL